VQSSLLAYTCEPFAKCRLDDMECAWSAALYELLVVGMLCSAFYVQPVKTLACGIQYVVIHGMHCRCSA
jgi:hypothetical protein